MSVLEVRTDKGVTRSVIEVLGMKPDFIEMVSSVESKVDNK